MQPPHHPEEKKSKYNVINNKWNAADILWARKLNESSIEFFKSMLLETKKNLYRANYYKINDDRNLGREI